MKRLVILSVLAEFVFALAFVDPLSAEPVRVATFNVYNYLVMDRRVDGQFRPRFPKPENEKTAIRSAIREINPDILALQEMGPAPFLEELRQDLAREGLVYEHSVLLEAVDPERHVAVLSKIPFAGVTPHASVEFMYFNERERVKRGMLEVDFHSPSGDWTLFVVHLKSRYSDRPDDPLSEIRRNAEARTLRDVILDRFPEPNSSRFMIAGDLNGAKDSRALARFRMRGKTEIGHLLPAVDSRGESWTYRYERAATYSQVDYLLASGGLVDSVIDGTVRIHDGEQSLQGSDHRLVYMDLNLEPVPDGGSESDSSPTEIDDQVSDRKP